MVTVRMTDETYAMIRRQIATMLECEMLHGKVQEWDEENEKVLRALLEFNTQVCYCGKG